MKNSHSTTIICGLGLALAALSGQLYAQGELVPRPGRPTPTMKSLEEIWDKIESLAIEVGKLQGQNAMLRQQNDALQQQSTALQEQLNEIAGVVTIEMVTVGNPGNPPDPGNTVAPDTFGAVGYEYKIGKYEVTNAQYVQFLNAVAATDINFLYDQFMPFDPRGGITRSGQSGSYTYAVKANMGNKPVNFVNWFDAMRFCNWLHNGQPRGLQDGLTTEDGAYTLTAPGVVAMGSDPTHGANGRNSGARFWLPSEDEWYKAAYHQPAARGGGDADDYWLYPTRSNIVPTIATADVFGNINNDTANIANHDLGADWNGQDGNVTTVGSGGPGSASFYGAFDIGGNVEEWNEQINVAIRGVRGGAFGGFPALRSSSRNFTGQTSAIRGFRVAGS